MGLVVTVVLLVRRARRSTVMYVLGTDGLRFPANPKVAPVRWDNVAEVRVRRLVGNRMLMLDVHRPEELTGSLATGRRLNAALGFGPVSITDQVGPLTLEEIAAVIRERAGLPAAPRPTGASPPSRLVPALLGFDAFTHLTRAPEAYAAFHLAAAACLAPAAALLWTGRRIGSTLAIVAELGVVAGILTLGHGDTSARLAGAFIPVLNLGLVVQDRLTRNATVP